ncbi:MAG: tyrosine-protein phosphatase [Planctomycetota bacterium]|jgi:protein-tyrosine phosphatase
MIVSTCENTFDAQIDRLEVHMRQHFIDVHCHCLAGLDDGPAMMTESISLCRELAKDGVTTVVATPHQLGRFKDCNSATRVREAARHLNETLKDAGVPLVVRPGAEVYVDENICRFLADDTVLTLADNGKYLLLELPAQASIAITPLLAELASKGVQCVISHAERIAPFIAHRRTLLRWLDYSAHLQITAASLLGVFGSRVRRTAWGLLDSGLVALVATDSHNIGTRRPRMRAAFEQISARLGTDAARLACIENPLRVVHGQDLLTVSLCDLQEVER